MKQLDTSKFGSDLKSFLKPEAENDHKTVAGSISIDGLHTTFERLSEQ